MLSPTTSLGPFTIQTYTFLIGFGFIIASGWVVFVYRRHHTAQIASLVDSCLAGLVAGVLVARALHVVLHWSYFEQQRAEITQFSAGGLNWHGAVLGALVGILLVARWRRLRIALLLDAFAPAVGLLALLAWWGCGTSHCAYGAEVPTLADYPGWLVWERGDIFNLIAPRYATQPLGMAWAAIVLLFTLILTWRGWLNGRRLWFALALLAAGMFVLGFLRADFIPVVGALRADQLLDGAVVALAAVLAVLTSTPGKSSAYPT